ncbi:polysaccharide biosynthesis tyrosine autokinase [Modestobacter sp. VKM Ac-2978]|uniref:polysaccharide biosynthesis tyrosine autokinase n=1 Tax=Modestobacter sp. VKM Ac-2978 TaxID=3004132 RepID=UPI0022AA8F50|nr:polysaccharide biosynthesis tyrosine autokinase [Modestobacter sp. VKM Ac-2978]MCZ2846985.1 polysaccharide biosynthesis tyrosine autokinase [Modestobacter sp. VKM Ac-2978]
MQFFVSTAGSGTTSDAFQGGQFAQQRVASYTGFLTGNELAARVVRELGSDITAAEVAESIDATTVPGTVLIDVTVTSSSAARADEIAAALSQAFPALVADLESGGDEADAPVNVELTDRPDVAVEPSPPLAVENTLVGVLLGLVLGGAAAIARVLLDRTVTDQELAEDIAGAPVTGVVFHDDALHAGHTLDGVAPRTAEQYRQLATSLQYLNVDAPPTVIMVSSSVPSEGKTTMVVNLALALAEAGHRVTVVEADLRRPKVTEYLGLVSGAGVTNVLTGTADVEDVVQLVGEGQLRVIAAGPTPPNPSRLLGSSQMAALLAKLRSDNDYVLVDAAPLLPVADSRALAASVDGVLLSIRHGSTTKDQLREAVAALGGVGATTLGVVLNLVPLRSDLAAAHAYGLEYGYAANRTTQLDPTAELVPEASLAGPRQAPGTERPGAPPRAGAPVLQRQDK